MLTVNFKDEGQDFLEWILNNDNVIVDCQPFQSRVWVGRTARLNQHNGATEISVNSINEPNSYYAITHDILSVEETNSAYQCGYADGYRTVGRDVSRYKADPQYKYGYNVGMNFKTRNKAVNHD